MSRPVVARCARRRHSAARTVRQPLIDPDVFRDNAFTKVVAIGFVFNFCLYGSIFCLAVGLGRLRGLDALDTGFALLPMTVVTAAMALSARGDSSPGSASG